MRWVFLVGGSCLGGVLRYVFSGLIYQTAGAQFPLGTFFVNVSGCFLLGFLAIFAEEKLALDENARLFLMTGFCGAYTTFSTWMLETYTLMRDGQLLYGFLNILLSVAVGFLLFKAGMWTAEVL